MKIRACQWAVTVSILLSVGGALAQVPGSMMYQGRLTDAAGSPLSNTPADGSDGWIDVQFIIYDELNAPVWTNIISDVSVINGLFSVTLTGLDTNIIRTVAGTPRKLEVLVQKDGGGWVPLTPRKDIISTANAFQAANADKLDGKDWTDLVKEEKDPQVGLVADAASDNYVPSWNATANNEADKPGMLVKGTIYDNRAAVRIGIGTANPEQKVDVNGAVRVTGAEVADLTPNAAGLLSFDTVNGDVQLIAQKDLIARGGVQVKTRLADGSGTLTPVEVEPNGNVLLTQDGDNVGVGSAAAPTQKLDVNGAVKVRAAAAGETATDTALMDWTGNDMRFISQNDAANRGGYTFVARESDGGSPNVPLQMEPDGDVLVAQAEGKVGVGTATPAQELDVNGAVRVTGAKVADTTPAVGLMEFDTASGDLRLTAQNTDAVRGGVQIATREADGGGAIVPVEVEPSGNVLLTQDGGNVGVGSVAAPTQKLDVNGAVKVRAAAAAETATDTALMDWTGNDLRFVSQNDAANRGGYTFVSRESDNGNPNVPLQMEPDGDVLVAQAAGNVGVGTVAPQLKLDVRSTANQAAALGIFAPMNVAGNWTGLLLGHDSATDFKKAALLYESTDADARGKLHLALNANDTPGNATLADARLTVAYNGNVGIGQTSPEARLDVAGPVKITDGTEADGYVLTSDDDGLASWKPAPETGIGDWNELLATGTVPTDFTDEHISWSEVTDKPAAGKWEIDPQVDDMVNNYVPSWDAAIQNDAGEAGALVKGTLYDNRANGHVGIGTANPETIFHHVGRDTAGSVSQVTRISDSGAGATINREIARVAGVDAAMEEATGNGTVNWYSGGNLGTPRLTLAPNGDLGMGVSPSYPLHVSRSTPGYVAALQNAYNGAALYFGYGGGQGAVIEVGSGDDALAFQVSKNWNALLTVRGDPDSVGNVGVGIVNPSAKLHVNGQIKITDGTQGSGKVLTSGADGLASWQAVPTAVASGWTDEGTVVRLTTSSDNVGVGTTTPSEKLDVQGGKLRVENTIIYDNEIYRHDTAVNKDLYVGSRTTANTILQSSGGNVGVGVYPGYPFHVYRDTADWLVRLKNANAGGAEVYLAHGGGYGAIIEAGADASAGTYALHVQKDGTAFFTVKGDGKTGIGTASPQAPLHHTGRATAGGYSDVTRVSDSGQGAGANREIYSVGGSALSAVETLPSGNMNFYSGGNASTPTLALNADGTVEAKRGDYRFQGPAQGNYRQFLALQSYPAPFYTPKTVLVPAAYGFRVSSPGNVMPPLLDLPQDGILWVWGGYTSGSDERMKFYPETLDYGLSTVKMLKPKRYFRASYTLDPDTGDITFDPDSVTNDIGLVAQDVYAVIKEAVRKPHDETKEVWSLEYDKFIPVLVKAIQELAELVEPLQQQIISSQDLIETVQEQQQQIDAQQQTIADLLKRVEALENK